MTATRKHLFIHFFVTFATLTAYMALTDNLSGYYYRRDDFEFYNIQDLLNQAGFWKAYFSNGEVQGHGPRIRIIYYLLRYFFTLIAGVNLIAHHLIVNTLIAGSSTFLLGFARRLGMGLLFSTFFSLFVFVGLQSEILIRLGPNEQTGLLFYSFALFITAKTYRTHNTNWESGILVAALICASFCKESFLVAILPVIFLRASLVWFRTKDLKKALKSHLPSDLILIIFSAALLLWMVTLGITNVGYAGIDQTTFPQLLPTAWWFLKNHGFLPLSAGLIHLFFGKEKKHSSIVFIFALLLLMTQLVIYSKSGFHLEHRFLMPATLASYLITAYSMEYLSRNFNNAGVYEKGASLILIVLGIFYLWTEVRHSHQTITNYARETKQYTFFLEEIAQSFEKNHKPVLIIATSFYFHEEFSMSIPVWLKRRSPELTFLWHAPLIKRAKIPYLMDLYQHLMTLNSHEVKELDEKVLNQVGTVAFIGPLNMNESCRPFKSKNRNYVVYTKSGESWENSEELMETAKSCFPL